MISVLIVEDQAILRESLARSIADQPDMTVAAAIADASCALDVVREQRPDMILMDVQMPVMNGYEATEAIRRSSHEQAKTIPIIAMTANAFSDDIHHSLTVGMNAHISKPVEMKVLEKTISSIKFGGG